MSTPATPTAWTRTLNQGVTSPALRAAIQYGTRTTAPITADANATVSHQDDPLNKPQVATVKPAIVTRHRTWVSDHKTPVVDTSGPANAGVSHKNVVPNR